MENIGTNRSKMADLRWQAEQKMFVQKLSGIADLAELSMEEVQLLVHELRVHQVELEMQNEELRSAQLRLEASRNNYMELYEFSPVAYLTLDSSGQIIAANLTAVRLLGVERKKLLKVPLSRFVASEKADFLHLYLQQVLQAPERRRCEMRFVGLGGREFYAQMETALLRGDTDQPGRLLTVLVDITDRRQAEELMRKSEAALKVSQEQYRFLVNNTADLIYSLDRRGRFTAVNKSVCRLLGVNEEQIIGKTHPELGLPESFVREWESLHQQVLATGNTVNGEIIYPGPEGASRTYEVVLSPVFDEKGRVASIRGNSRDTTEHKIMEEELLKADKLKTISMLAGGIAHDFNNYLATLLGNISLLKLYKDDPQKILEKLEKLEAATLQAKELTYQLFTFATGGTPLKEKIFLNEIITDCLNFASSGTNVLVQPSLAVNLQVVEADKGQLSQVLNNIIINAVQAMPHGGTIRVKTENVTLDKASMGALLPLPQGNYIKLSLADEGAGIPQEDLPRIFDPFYTTKEKGHGLGLATAYSIIKNHKGHMDVTSTVGTGTTFHIYLPAADQPVLSPRVKDRIIHGSGKILVMDDEAEVREAVGEMLAYLGYEVHFAAEGHAAIRMYLEARQSVPFDLVLLDLTVKGGLGGKDTLTALRKIDPAVQAVISSGYSDDRVMTEFKEFGFKGIVKKPYTIEMLSAVIAKTLKKA